jgi:hypothetical protein
MPGRARRSHSGLTLPILTHAPAAVMQGVCRPSAPAGPWARAVGSDTPTADNTSGRSVRKAPGIILLLLICRLAAAQASDAIAGTDGFRALRLGMMLEDAKRALQQDPYFAYRGDPDVSFLPLSQQTLIECAGTSYIARAYFQFHDQRLATITLVLDGSQLDHYSLFTRLTDKYGPHSELNPQRILWRFAAVDFALERPLTVKYIDREVFDKQQARGVAREAMDDISRRRFLEQF